jgi:hypothetical protein
VVDRRALSALDAVKALITETIEKNEPGLSLSPRSSARWSSVIR